MYPLFWGRLGRLSTQSIDKWSKPSLYMKRNFLPSVRIYMNRYDNVLDDKIVITSKASRIYLEFYLIICMSLKEW